MSSFAFQSMLLLLFAALSWNRRTDGIFQAALNVNASALQTGRTEKSLNKCHLLFPGGVTSACATSGSSISLSTHGRHAKTYR